MHAPRFPTRAAIAQSNEDSPIFYEVGISGAARIGCPTMDANESAIGEMLDSQDRDRYVRLDANERAEFLRMHPAFWSDYLWFNRNRRALYFRMDRALRATFLIMSDRERKTFETCSDVDRQMLVSLVHERTMALREMVPTLYEAYRQQLD